MSEEIKVKYSMIEPLIIEQIRDYADRRIPPGHFVKAVMQNDLCEAVDRADNKSLRTLPNIVGYVYWEIPSICWGSKEKYEAWLKGKRE